MLGLCGSAGPTQRLRTTHGGRNVCVRGAQEQLSEGTAVARGLDYCYRGASLRSLNLPWGCCHRSGAPCG